MTDEHIDRLIGILLRVGVLIAAGTTLAGAIWHFAQSGGAMPDYRVFRGEPVEVRTLSGVLRGICEGNSRDLIQLGLFLLIATPVARVMLCVVAFATQRDRTYVAITLIVLSILIASLAGVHL